MTDESYDPSGSVDYGYNKGIWFFIVVYRDSDVQIAAQITHENALENGLVPHRHLRSSEAFVVLGKDREPLYVDVFVPGELHRLEPGEVISIKSPPPTLGDLEKATEEEFQASEKVRLKTRVSRLEFA